MLKARQISVLPWQSAYVSTSLKEKKSRSPAIATCCLLAYSQALMGSLLLQVTGTRSASSGSGSPNATANWTRACASCSWQMLQCRHAPSMPVHLYNVHLARCLGRSVSLCTVGIAASLSCLPTTASIPTVDGSASCLQLLQHVLEN